MTLKDKKIVSNYDFFSFFVFRKNKFCRVETELNCFSDLRRIFHQKMNAYHFLLGGVRLKQNFNGIFGNSLNFSELFNFRPKDGRDTQAKIWLLKSYVRDFIENENQKRKTKPL